jgi:serine/threonine protein phosphatase PrpC
MIRTEVEIGVKSIPGQRHRVEGRENEDVAFVTREHPLFDAVMLVADGMGGHPAPKRAAQTAIDAARDYLLARERREEWGRARPEPIDVLKRAVQHANRCVRQLAGAPERAVRSVAVAPAATSLEKPPGCTLIAAIVVDGRLAVANVGDGSVFLCRDSRLLHLAGGESRRLGSRPEEYLGRADQIEVETTEQPAEPGDRVLLCTDGLTRYLGAGRSHSGSDGRERLQQIVSRLSAEPQALASQLTADSRGELYEDDTTVIVADVGPSRDVPDAPPESARREQQPMPLHSNPAPPRAGSPPWLFALGLLTALAAGVALGSWHPWRPSSDASRPPFQPFAAAPVDLSPLPRGGVLLIQPGTDRLYVLRTRPAGAPASDEPITLSALRVLPGKGVKDTGNSYRLDAARGRLTDPNGHTYPVTVDSSTGVIEIQQGALLKLYSRPAGLRIAIDGRAAGHTPVSQVVSAGKHQVQMLSPEGSDEVWDKPVDIPPGATITWNLDFGARGRRTARP